MRLTKIICTLGPATIKPEAVKRLLDGGMNIARLNCSHGTLEQHRGTIRMLKDLNPDNHFSILLDTEGAEVRSGDRSEPLQLNQGQEVVFTHQRTEKNHPVIAVNYAKFAEDAKHARHILMDNGEFIFDILDISPDRVLAKARHGALIGSRRHINLPGAHVNLEAVTDKDREDIKMGCDEGVDFVALSFIRNAEEIESARAYIQENGGHAAIIAKIEHAEAFENIESIIAASDGVMVARGDLGAELSFEQVPAIQDSIVERCRAAGKPVIVATHMLESMIENPLPTRAEVTDIAHAVATGADCTMLSGETAVGKHPFDALHVMIRTLEETEQRYATSPLLVGTKGDGNGAHAGAAIAMASSLGAAAIVAFTKSGSLARSLSQFRPTVPVIAFTDTPALQRKLQIHYGISPRLLPAQDDPLALIESALEHLRNEMMLKPGDPIVVIAQRREGRHVLDTVQSRIFN